MHVIRGAATLAGIRATKTQRKRWHARARSSGLSFQKWAVAVLDSAPVVLSARVAKPATTREDDRQAAKDLAADARGELGDLDDE